MKGKTYSSFKEYLSNHRNIWRKIRLSLRKNKKETAKTSRYDYVALTSSDISHKFTVTVRNMFDTL